MPTKTVPLSVRISSGDAEFLARLQVEGATTPSEKLRSILKEDRRRREGYRDYGRVLTMTQEAMAPALTRLREAENRRGVHSEVIHQVADWLPRLMATFVTGVVDGNAEGGDEEVALLSDFEQRLVDQVLGLAEAILRLGVTEKVRGYDPDVVNGRIEPLLEIVDVVRSTRTTRKEA